MFKDLQETSKERIKNPFLSSFFVAFIAINWKPILVLMFSSLIIEERIILIENTYLDWLHYFLYPLLIAIFYTLLFPYIMVGIDRLLKSANLKKIESFYSQEIIRTENQKGLVKAQVELDLLRTESSDIKIANGKIESLTKANDDKKLIINELQNQVHSLQSELDKTKNEVLKTYTRNDPEVLGAMFRGFYDDEDKTEVFKELIEATREGISIIRYDYYDNNKHIIQELEKDGVIELGKRQTEGIDIRITTLGKEFWSRIEPVYPQRIS